MIPEEKAEVIALQRQLETLDATPVFTTKEERNSAIVALRAAGASYDVICKELGISRGTVGSVLKKEESRRIMETIRDVQKMETAANSLAIQRKIFDSIREMPMDKDHANAVRQFVAAFAQLYDKSAHAAGEATERIESKNLTITLDDKTRYLEELRAARALREEREAVASAI